MQIGVERIFLFLDNYEEQCSIEQDTCLPYGMGADGVFQNIVTISLLYSALKNIGVNLPQDTVLGNGYVVGGDVFEECINFIRNESHWVSAVWDFDSDAALVTAWLTRCTERDFFDEYLVETVNDVLETSFADMTEFEEALEGDCGLDDIYFQKALESLSDNKHCQEFISDNITDFDYTFRDGQIVWLSLPVEGKIPDIILGHLSSASTTHEGYLRNWVEGGNFNVIYSQVPSFWDGCDPDGNREYDNTLSPAFLYALALLNYIAGGGKIED